MSTTPVDAPVILEALDPATGLITAPTAFQGITLNCSTSASSSPTDWIAAEIQDRDATAPVWSPLAPPVQLSQTPVPPKFNVYVPAPSFGFRHGRYWVRSLQLLDAGGTPGPVIEQSEAAPFAADVIPPYASSFFQDSPHAPVYPADLPANTAITNAYLDMHGGVSFTIPDNDFSDPNGQFESGDLLRLYWGQAMFPQPSNLVAQVPMLPTGNVFFLPASVIRSAGSGIFRFIYTITDRALNTSRPSLTESRVVNLS